MSELKLPELGEGVHEGELIKWKVKVGDQVIDDQLVCEIMTDKATIELPAPFTGKVTALNAKEGDCVRRHYREWADQTHAGESQKEESSYLVDLG